MGNSVNYQKIRGAKRAAHLDAAERAGERFSVFLAGPYINTAKTIRHMDNKASDASLLRYSLYEELSNLDHTIYLGEDVALRENGEKHYGPGSNAVVFERHFIRKHAHALIVLPSSPGSFCEVGDWVPEKEICEKMFLVVDRKYKRKPSYINSGIVKFASRNGATIEYLDYKKRDQILEACKGFLDNIAETLRIDSLYGK